MVQPLQFSIDELVAKAESFDATLGVNRSLQPAVIEDVVTLSEQALAALPQSNLLTFADPGTKTSSTQSADAAPASEPQVQKLLNDGYSLSQIAQEFNIPVAQVEIASQTQHLNAAA